MTKRFRVRNENSHYHNEIGILTKEGDYVYDPYGNGFVLDFDYLGDTGLWFAREELEELDQ